HAERERRRADAAAGQRKADRIDDAAVGPGTVLGAQRGAAERLAPLIDRADFGAQDVVELDFAGTRNTRHGAAPSPTTEGSIFIWVKPMECERALRSCVQ